MPGARVLDLGCRPGSWMQYAVKVVGAHGAVVGVDREPLPGPIPGAEVLDRRHLRRCPTSRLLCGLAAFDVVLSDMAPDTTGIRATDQARSAALVEEALARAERLLAPRGGFVAKIFQGPDVEQLRKRMARALLRRAPAQARGLAPAEHRDLPGRQELRARQRKRLAAKG